jgi:hypothetical protein
MTAFAALALERKDECQPGSIRRLKSACLGAVVFEPRDGTAGD